MSFRSVSVFLRVVSCSFVVMMLRVKMVAVCHVSMVSGFLVIAGFVMLRGLLVMARGMLAVFGRVLVVLRRGFMIGHCLPPSCAC